MFLLLLPALSLAAGPETLIDNRQARVQQVTDQPHVRTALHSHPLNRVMIYLDGGRQEIVTSEGVKTVQNYRPGEVRWSPASDMHTSEVVSAAPIRIIEIELKKTGKLDNSADCPLHPLHVAAEQATLEFENDQVRVFRVKLAPHGTLAMHEHVVNKIVVNLMPMHERVTTATGQEDVVDHAETTAAWGGPVKHREQNLAATAMDSLVIELKN
jgi:quercetin dioxygenase-like cupin family protein